MLFRSSGAVSPAAGRPSHLQEVYADLLARKLPPGVTVPEPRTEAEATRVLREGGFDLKHADNPGHQHGHHAKP